MNLTPEFISDIEAWKINRRKFLSSLLVGGAVISIPIVPACTSTNSTKKYLANEVFSAQESEIIDRIQMVLFPDDGNGPSSHSINAFSHLIWVLSDTEHYQWERDYITSKMAKIILECELNYHTTFTQLTQEQLEEYVSYMSQRVWSRRWLSLLLTFIFEALTLDPIYQINTNEQGWKWLEHQSGLPRPTEELTYKTIFKTIDFGFKSDI